MRVCSAALVALAGQLGGRCRLATPDDPALLLDGSDVSADLRTEAAGAAASRIAALPAVRQALLDWQRRCRCPPGLVTDGRDMGTVVFPDAEVKVFLTADLSERARRRFLERENREPDEEELRAEAAKIQERDDRDSARAIAPLKKAEGSTEVDTSELAFEEQVEAIIHRVKKLD